MPAIRIFSFPFSAFTFFTRHACRIFAPSLQETIQSSALDSSVQTPLRFILRRGSELRDLSVGDLSAGDLSFEIVQSCCWRPLAAGTLPTWTTVHPRWSTRSLEGAVDQARQIRRNLRRPDRFSDPTVQAQSNLLYLMSSVTPSAWPVGWGGAGEQRAVASERRASE
jgi:hypothetical protein